MQNSHCYARADLVGLYLLAASRTRCLIEGDSESQLPVFRVNDVSTVAAATGLLQEQLYWGMIKTQTKLKDDEWLVFFFDLIVGEMCFEFHQRKSNKFQTVDQTLSLIRETLDMEGVKDRYDEDDVETWSSMIEFNLMMNEQQDKHQVVFC